MIDTVAPDVASGSCLIGGLYYYPTPLRLTERTCQMLSLPDCYMRRYFADIGGAIQLQLQLGVPAAAAGAAMAAALAWKLKQQRNEVLNARGAVFVGRAATAVSVAAAAGAVEAQPLVAAMPPPPSPLPAAAAAPPPPAAAAAVQPLPAADADAAAATRATSTAGASLGQEVHLTAAGSSNCVAGGSNAVLMVPVFTQDVTCVFARSGTQMKVHIEGLDHCLLPFIGWRLVLLEKVGMCGVLEVWEV